MIEPNEEQMAWDWRRRNNEEPYSLYASLNIIAVIKSRVWDGWGI